MLFAPKIKSIIKTMKKLCSFNLLLSVRVLPDVEGDGRGQRAPRQIRHEEPSRGGVDRVKFLSGDRHQARQSEGIECSLKRITNNC